MTDHAWIESLLGAYSLDAVDPEEAELVERHLRECPRCRAEVAAHREVAALLANTGTDAPEGLWDRIAADLAGDAPAPPLARPPFAVLDGSRPAVSPRRRLLVRGGGLVAVAAAALVIALLGVQVSNLNGQVNALHKAGLAPAVAAVLAGPHQSVILTSASRSDTATIALGAGGVAYWVASDLPVLATGRTYQLWALVGDTVVSLGVLGPNPRLYSAFRFDTAMSVLMVTAEPAGGTPAPTTPVLVRGLV
jgi:anti-sigma factor RsiW